MRAHLLFAILTICGTVSLWGQSATDSLVVMNVNLNEVEILQTHKSLVEQQGASLLLDMQQLEKMPRFLGTSDPIRYLQSLPGIANNTETRAGLYLHGCDAYQTFVGINGAPVYYPNHLMGLFSTFIAPHFALLKVEQTIHDASAPNRVGGLVELQTKHIQPARFGAEGSIGMIASDATFTIPCGKKSALWLSARASYPIFKILGQLAKIQDMSMQYYFMDYNLTYSYHPTDKDELVASGFYSRDKIGLYINDGTDINIRWQNLTGSVYWNHHSHALNLRSALSFSGFNTKLDLTAKLGQGKTNANMASVDWKNTASFFLNEQMKIEGGLDYAHYFFKPLDMNVDMNGTHIDRPMAEQFADEISLYADWKHEVTSWFNYAVGLRGSLYIQDHFVQGAPDPRITFEFTPKEDHHIFLHAGLYHQYFHKVALLEGGLPADFFIPATSAYKGESAHTASLKYQVDFLNRQFSLSTDIYFKQLSNIIESTSNIFSLINSSFRYEDQLLLGNGRNYGWNILFQRNRGKLTGLVSYSLAWAKRQLPELEGITTYTYNASQDIRHDLNIILNWQVAKKWNLGANFVCMSGLPCTAATEGYLINGQMVCKYTKHNDFNLPTYHRLDVTCSYDIIQKNGHVLGLNLSIYNVYNQRNAQFIVYRGNLQPIYGSSISTILPSISLYGRW